MEKDSPRSYRFDQLEGMRGILAWWVVLGHLVQQAQLTPKEIPDALDFIRMAMHPVYAFMILSGFVIAHLVAKKDEPYSVYIFRRYFRLVPVMVLGMAISAAIAASGYRLNFPRQDILTHTFLHLSLLHGAVPDNVLKNAGSSFIGPGWSISLEWQFYIFAPFIIRALMRNGRGAAICLFAAVALLLLQIPQDARSVGEWVYRKPSILLTTFPFFLAGVLAYFASNFVGQKKGESLIFLTGLAAATLWQPVSISNYGWVATVAIGLILYVVIWSDSLPARALRAPYLVFLGKISYSTYLLHFPVVLLTSILVARPSNDWFALAEYAIISVPIILGLSALSFYFVERPCIELAAKWSKCLSVRAVRAGA